VAVRMMLGQLRFLSPFGAARSDGIANETSDEALGVHHVYTACKWSVNGALGF
jgi:hypothetical protein